MMNFPATDDLALAPAPMSRQITSATESAVLLWDGQVPTELITQVEARIAAHSRFGVLAAAPPLGRGLGRGLLERWWYSTRGRLDATCVAWAMLTQGSDVRPALLCRDERWSEIVDFPVRACADQAEALWWLRTKLGARALSPRPRIQ